MFRMICDLGLGMKKLVRQFQDKSDGKAGKTGIVAVVNKVAVEFAIDPWSLITYPKHNEYQPNNYNLQ